ncbi:MAG: hypothetical protein PHV93_02125 [Candidatus Pacebacteria bacterium]|nr:hypothetical protein [Candidatus Paceibacterota bacterium]
MALKQPILEADLLVLEGGVFCWEMSGTVSLEGLISFLRLGADTQTIEVHLAEGPSTNITVGAGTPRKASGNECKFTIPCGAESCTEGKLGKTFHFRWQSHGKDFIASIGPPKSEEDEAKDQKKEGSAKAKHRPSTHASPHSDVPRRRAKSRM